jgi:hypothetical protein
LAPHPPTHPPTPTPCQALCFLAGANSIFDGDKLLTTPNNDRNEDLQMFELLGLKSRPAFIDYPSGELSWTPRSNSERVLVRLVLLWCGPSLVAAMGVGAC